MTKLLIVILITLGIQSSVVATDFERFVSRVHGFTVEYPTRWKLSDTVHPETVISVASPDGDDFNVVVLKDPALNQMSAEEFAQGMSRYFSIEQLRSIYPDSKLIEKGTTTLSQQPAAYYVFDYSLSAMGREISMRAYVITTKYGDRQYTLTFRTPQQFFEEYMPVIQMLALSFQLIKRPDNL